MENEENIIKEIREKIKKLKIDGKNYVRQCSREFQEDIKKYGFENGNRFINWIQNNGILKNLTRVKQENDSALVREKELLSKLRHCCICFCNDARYKYPNKNNWDKKSFMCNICYQKEYRKENDGWKKKNNPKRLYKIPEGSKCYICGNIAICRHRDNEENLDKKSFMCNMCYQKEYRKRYPNIVKKHNNELSKASNWKNGELDPYTSSGKGYIVEQFSCKTLELENLNIRDNTFRAKCDTTRHIKYGDIQIKGASYNTKERSWSRTLGEAQKFDTLLMILMDRYMPWRNVRKAYAIPEVEVYGLRSIAIYDNPNPSIGSKWDKFIIDAKPFNDTYHNLTIEDCPALRKDKWEKWLELTRTN